MSDLFAVLTLGILAGGGCVMVVIGRFMWVNQHRLFGLMLALGGTAILSVVLYVVAN